MFQFQLYHVSWTADGFNRQLDFVMAVELKYGNTLEEEWSKKGLTFTKEQLQDLAHVVKNFKIYLLNIV